jgi:hypothetical protein
MAFRTEVQHSCDYPTRVNKVFGKVLGSTYVEVAKSVVIPPADRVDESRLVKPVHQLSQALLRRPVSLTPALVVDDLP